MILITICARGGSKGIPNKNIKMLAGKPLIYYSIELAKMFSAKFDAKISLSTDSQSIIEVASNHDLNTEYTRPKELATDKSGKIPAIKDLLLYEETLLKRQYDYILDLDVTSPIRSIEDLTNALSILTETSSAINLFSVSKAKKNPYFNMVERKPDGFYKLSKEHHNHVNSRQVAPIVYELNAAFYLYRRSFFEIDHTSPITDRSLIYLMPDVCFDLDEMEDWEYLEYLVSNKKIQLI